MSVSIKITLPLFTILFVSWCAIGTPIEKSERLITNQDVTLSEEQRQLLQHMRNEMIVTDQLSESCRLVSEGNEKAALTKLQSIEWSNTWLKISKNGVHNDGIIEYFKKRLQLGSEGCDVFTQDLIRGVY
ncbi:TPA: hypothetical protein ACWKRV_005586 [Escherichia coli]|nr:MULTISPECIES: hypothetical protein [Escherichia]EAX7303302.1 hypothetical protein [Salmonella enterica]EBS0250451.1 hypothetical protein [Salmonella enterica subsp. enterica serovar Give]EDU9347329.1 hypothetical protein [Salmonella enterica subsp. enterica]EEP8235255.1 hypothetical protein [Salmonella enterica subsp. enterica serovar Chester]EAX7451622.1 hypothetical protein [Salmonella enterica]